MRLFKKYGSIVFILAMALFSIFYMGNEEAVMSFSKRLPVIMYHSVRDDEEGMYIIPVDKLEADFKYLKEKGYEAVTANELVTSLRENKKLPSKPVIITFDDGYYNNLKYALPLLEKYDFKAVVSVIGKCIEEYDRTEDRNEAYACLNSSDLKKLTQSGRVEIGNHSYDMHRQGARNGTMQIKGERDESYKKAFSLDAEKSRSLIESATGETVKTYTYPYGQITKKSEEYLKDMGYEVFFTCWEKVNILEGSDFPLSLGRFNRDGTLTTSEFMQKAGI